MVGWLLLLVLLPFADLTLLVLLGRFSVLLTLGWVLAAAVCGVVLAWWQGGEVLGRVRKELAAGELPAQPLLDGLFILAASVFLIIPGLISDAAGMSLLVPACRRWYRRRLVRWLRKRFEISGVVVTGSERSDVVDGKSASHRGEAWTLEREAANVERITW